MANRFLSNIRINDAYTLPASDGATGQVITTDGLGYLSFSDVDLSRTQSNFVFYDVKNSSGVTINKGTAVMAAGTNGNSGHILIAPMVADGSVEPKYFIGVLESTLQNGEIGRAIHFGELDQFDTSVYTNGDILWLDPEAPGGYTPTEPLGPSLKIAAAIVINSAVNGKIRVRVQGNASLNDIHDVKIVSESDGDLLQWNSFEGVWENKALAASGITSTQISNWDTAYGWGNHSTVGYLTSFDITTQTDDKYLRSDVDDIANGTITFENGIRIGTGSHGTSANTATITFGEGTPTSDSMYLEYDGEGLSGDNNALFIRTEKNGSTLAAFKYGKDIEFTSNNWSATAAGTITAVNFVGGGGSITGVNATLLDGINSSQFLRSDASDTTTGRLTIQTTGDPTIGEVTPTNGYLVLTNGTNSLGFDTNEIHSTSTLYIGTNANDLVLRPNGVVDILANLDISPNNSNGNGRIRTIFNGGSPALEFSDNASGISAEQFFTIGANDTGVGKFEIRFKSTAFGTAWKDEGTLLAEFKADDSSVSFPAGNVFINNKLAIGTTTPQAPLHVIAASSSDDALIQEWSYTSGVQDKYSLMLKQTVTSGVVRYNFSMVNDDTAYNDVLVLDRGDVGIGTTSPTAKLDVIGYGKFDNGLIIDGVDTGNPSADSGQIRVSGYGILGNRGSFYITNPGVVQIGVGSSHDQNPAAEFGSSINLYKATNVSEMLTINETGGGILRLQNNDASNAQNQTLGSIVWNNQDGSSTGPNNAAIIEAQTWGTIGQGANLLFKTVAATTEGGDATTAMTLFGDGVALFNNSVGIGTTSPAQKLHVVGNVRVERGATGLGGYICVGNTTEQASNYSAYHFGNTADGVKYMKGGIAYATLASTYGRGDMHFLQNSVANSGNANLSHSVMVIKNDGKVGIGTTNFGTTTAKLLVGDYVFNGSSAIAQFDGFIRVGGSVFIHDQNNSSNQAELNVSANAELSLTGKFIASNDVIAFSDARVKENVETIDNALEKVLAMRGVSYNRTDQEDKSKKVGVIAQEIEKILPEVVTENSEGIKGVAYGNIVGVLIEAIKELKQEVNELKDIINKK